MENFTNVCSRGKEALLNEEYLSLPQHHSANRKTRFVDKIYVCMFVTIVIASIVSCICAVYCFKTLAESREILELCKTEHKESAKNFITATERLTQSTQNIDIDSSLDDVVDLDYDLDEEFEDSQLEEYEQDNEEVNSDDIEASGEEEQEADQNDHKRIRRDDDKCKRRCSKKSDNQKEKCLKRCSRKDRKGGRKQKPAMNLPSAQFEVKFTDTEIQNTVKKVYNAYEDEENVPLNIFKPSSWFDEKTSPVKFSGGRAITKTAGIYLVYAQAYIGGKETRKSIRLVQKRNNSEVNTLSCRTGIHPDLIDSSSGQLQTCSVLGLLNFKEGDTIEVQKGGDYVQIILDKDKTYFGIVQLSKLATPRNKSKKAKN